MPSQRRSKSAEAKPLLEWTKAVVTAIQTQQQQKPQQQGGEEVSSSLPSPPSSTLLPCIKSPTASQQSFFMMKRNDRVTVEVGGRSFVTSKSTLIKHSTYFALHSQHWQSTPVSSNSRRCRSRSSRRSTDDGVTDDDTFENDDKENSQHEKANDHHSHCNDDNGNNINDEVVYLDHDPDHFEVLLRYMRSGMIRSKELTGNPYVLNLADILGLESLITEVKARAYYNMNPRFTSSSEEEGDMNDESTSITRKFDVKYGGIRQAIMNGLLPKYLTQYEVEHEYATIQCSLAEGIDDPDTCRVVNSSSSKNSGSNTSNAVQMPLLGALNWLYFHGFTKFEKDMNFPICGDDDVKTFSRTIRGGVSSCGHACSSIISDPCTGPDSGGSKRKAFAMILSDRDDIDIILYPPGEDGTIPNGKVGENYENSKWCSRIDEESVEWLFEHGFSQREKQLEKIFQMHMISVLHNQYFAKEDDECSTINAGNSSGGGIGGDDNTSIADNGYFFQIYSKDLNNLCV